MKEETLEEAFDRIYNSMDFTEFDFTSFEQGAKWQQERMYSEEEVGYLLYSLKNYLGFGNEVDEKKWFEQFKKK